MKAFATDTEMITPRPTESRLLAELATLKAERYELRECLSLVLLFHSGSPWDFDKQQAWANGLTAILGNATSRDAKIVGANGDGTWDRACPTNEATTKNLCNAVRAVLNKP